MSYEFKTTYWEIKNKEWSDKEA